ncbi:MAG: DUF4405 domain-containing protein [Verrucomicrobia bacterium]|nr:DUF4405 domain-containing protein [Verrucomicrobiota bacterium]MDA1006339.1 DUF4405 domain-containing protein [Verrucomicrobiota bacterium]
MKPNLGTLRRRATSLLTALTFLVLAVTGVLAFVRPFSIGVVGLHALMGFVFIVFVGIHVVNNVRPLKGYLHSRAVWVTLAITAALTSLFFLQPGPVKSLLGLSGNLGPAMERFEMREDSMVFQYSPSPDYQMSLTVKTGASYNLETPPQVAIWLENQGGYHIKTLHSPEARHRESLPYWAFKVKGWEKAKEEAEEGLDVVSSPTPNGSFDPADYILPADAENSTPYKLLIEINQLGDPHGPHADQPSLVYAVEIDNLRPTTFQLLDLLGYPKREDEDGKEAWSLYYVDDGYGSAMQLIDSALLTIARPKS